ncbi:hypothetical protein CLCR_03229 [Cladophialophora carrionii]|uniref:Uncharacterized protein n=1 Tax=Cladophialophora carrionii TaxID=86049 RepID=A0A1C1D2X7_9EURO|nr:hypothetical protein CLCR_03229 [Cladophialophora carrionii]
MSRRNGDGGGMGVLEDEVCEDEKGEGRGIAECAGRKALLRWFGQNLHGPGKLTQPPIVDHGTQAAAQPSPAV